MVMKIFSVLLIIVLSLQTNIFSQVEFTQNTIAEVFGSYFTSIYAIDVDSDGDMDVLSASANQDKIVWYENNGNENFTSHTITTNADVAWSVYAVDVDGDGDIDVLSASGGDDKITWYENDGNENFTSHTIATDAPQSISIYAIDVDGDGDMDVLSTSAGNYNYDRIGWYENDGNENFTSHTVTTSVDDPWSVYAVDVDDDGDMDVLSASRVDSTIAWYENDGNEIFTQYTITTSADNPVSVYAADVDDDGDMDVLSASATFFNDRIVWYENDGNENFTSHAITTGFGSPAWSVYTADVDGDDDMDVLSGAWGANSVTWYENDGNENFILHAINTQSQFVYSVYAIDVDGDGDMDALSADASGLIYWYENTGVVGIESISNEIPSEFIISQNYPNPFNPSTNIEYSIPSESFVVLKVYDILGNEVASLVNEQQQAGVYRVDFNASELSSGVYFYKLRAGNFIGTKKMILLR